MLYSMQRGVCGLTLPCAAMPIITNLSLSANLDPSSNLLGRSDRRND